jgi:hypothetical protein
VVLATALFIYRQKLAASLRESAAQRATIQSLQADLAQLQQQQLIRTHSERPPADQAELLRLRGEVTILKSELAAKEHIFSQLTTNLDRTPARPQIQLAGDRLFASRTNATPNPADEIVRAALNQKHQEIQQWWKAFLSYAEAHGGYLPIEFSEAAPYLPADFQSTIDLHNFQRSSSSSVRSNFRNIENPARTGLFKERTPSSSPMASSVTSTFSPMVLCNSSESDFAPSRKQPASRSNPRRTTNQPRE